MKIGQSRFKILPNSKSILKICQRLLNVCKCGKFCHTGLADSYLVNKAKIVNHFLNSGYSRPLIHLLFSIFVHFNSSMAKSGITNYLMWSILKMIYNRILR